MTQCETCNDLKPEDGRCNNCRRNEYASRQGLAVWTECKDCAVKRPLSKNGNCHPCLKMAGLRECSACRQVLGQFISFTGRSAVCKSCNKKPCCARKTCPKCLRQRGLKRCKKCDAVKVLEDFYPGHGRCKKCVSRINTLHQKATGVRYIASKQSRRNAQLRHKYGIDEAGYRALLEQQGGGCAICSAKEPDGSKLDIDHDHETGKVRGLLCRSHNTALGLFQDRLELLLLAAEYLRRSSAIQASASAKPAESPSAQAEAEEASAG